LTIIFGCGLLLFGLTLYL